MKKYTITEKEYAEMVEAMNTLTSENQKLRGFIDGMREQLIIGGVVSSKNVLKDYQEAYDYHDKTMKEVKPLSREYFIHYGRREGFRNAIELMTGTEM